MSSFIGRACALFIALCMVASSNAQDINPPSQGNVYVKVSQNRELTGTPIELTELKVTTSFGEVTIPMAKIDGIKMHATDDDAAVIAFKNGDLVTGKIGIDKVSIKTEWGKAHIKIDQIDQLVVNQAAAFYEDNTGGKKTWRFNNGIRRQ